MTIQSIKATLYYYLTVTVVAFLPYVGQPTILHATTGNETTHFFTAPETLSRGSIHPMSQEAQVIAKADYCEWVVKDWGWEDCNGIDKFIVSAMPGVDILLIETPNTDGYISLSDWKEESKTAINSITESLISGTKIQSQKSGSPIEFIGWRAYPDLIQEKKVLYYATELEWSGERVINIKASIFDRKGYITARIVPTNSTINSSEIKEIVIRIADKYYPKQEESYHSFINGDKVASYGAVGVLATMVGVKYSKGILSTILAFALVFLKKAGFILLLPLVMIKKIFQRKKTQTPTPIAHQPSQTDITSPELDTEKQIENSK